MASLNPPYFFAEYRRPIIRKQPTARERALGLTLKDVNWLGTVYGASHESRTSSTSPMTVETLTLKRLGKSEIPLAGAFMMSPSPEQKKALLYTPYAGIEVFENKGECLAALTQRLTDPTSCVDLTRFLSIPQRGQFTHKSVFTLATATVTGDVFEDQKKTIEANQAQGVQLMLDELRTTPTLSELLDEALSVLNLDPDFRNLALKDTRVNSFMASSDHNGNGLSRWVESASLGETLLQYYAKQAWPAHRTRTFSNPKQDKSAFTAKQRKQDVEYWESLVHRAAGVLSKLLNNLLLTWWHIPYDANKSRTDLFTQVMSDKFRADMLFKHQSESEIISSEEARYLLAVLLSDQTERSAWHSSLRIEKISIHTPYQHYVELAATFLISEEKAYLYTQSRGLQVLKDVEDLNDTLLSMLKTAGHQDELLNFLSLDERGLYLAMRDVQVSGKLVEGSVFEGMVNDIQEKQLSNLEHALTLYRRAEGEVSLEALLDCSLDIRQMLDSRLLALDAAGRWSLHPVSSGNGRPSTVQAERAKLQLQALQPEEDTLIAHRAVHPTLHGQARNTLDKAIKAQTLYQSADDIYVNTYSQPARDLEQGQPESSETMVEYFLKHLASTTKDIPQSPFTGYYNAPEDGVSARWHNLNSVNFNTIIRTARTNFLKHDVRDLPRQFLDRHGKDMIKTWMLGLRSEAELRRLNHTLSPNHYAILDTVLRADSMTRDKRHGLQGFLPDAFGLTLTINGEKTAQPLANCFVLTERGGLDPNLSGDAVLWTPQLGYEPFTSLAPLVESLKQRLNYSPRRTALLQNLSIHLRVPHQSYQLGPLQRIDGHFLENRQQSNLAHDLDAIDHWASLPLDTTKLQDRLNDALGRMAPLNIDRAKAIANTIVRQHALPVWLGLASTADQFLHAELLEQHRLSAPDNKDYLHGLPDLRTYVASTLTTLLKARYPDNTLDPDDILIPARVILNGHTQSLTEFALRHLPDLQPDNLTPKARGTTPLPTSLDGSAVVQIVRQLDIGKTYRDLLTTHLTADTDDARSRRDLFCRQLPWQVLRHAHEEKLEERLSASAWGFIQQIFDMPDAVARDAVSGATAMIRPLELIATAGAIAAKVLGVYVIGAKAAATGPLVLYAPYAPFSVLKEYATEENLQDDINTPGLLQEWIIRQLSDPEQEIFRNLFKPSESEKEKTEKTEDVEKTAEKVSLASTPIRGNVLGQLFHDNAQQLINMLASQFDKDGRIQWDGIANMLRTGASIALQFIAGKLTFPLVVWRSFKLFEASAEALQEQKFGEGLRTFIRGLTTLASLREGLDDSFDPDPTDTAAADPTVDEATPATTIATLDITHTNRTRLQLFEDVAVALTDLKKDPKIHVYHHAVSGRNYIPMAGKVYPVVQQDKRWCVRLGRESGPCVKRDAQGQWVLDLDTDEARFIHGAPGPSHGVKRSQMKVKAYGRREIRELLPVLDGFIESALSIALFYTFNCQRNLMLFRNAPYERVSTILNDMFGISHFNGQQLDKIDKSVNEIFDGLSEASLLERDSMRFVYGIDSKQRKTSFGFIIPEDPDRKIHLAERFFHPHLYPDNYRLTAPFDIDDHCRAQTLIHEMSHLTSGTEDIIYLEGMRPFVDLFPPNSPEYNYLFDIQKTSLSHLTPQNELFTTEDDAGRYGITGNARTKVLNVTQTTTLREARVKFTTDPDIRLDVILANADSVACLITNVGRMLDPGAT